MNFPQDDPLPHWRVRDELYRWLLAVGVVFLCLIVIVLLLMLISATGVGQALSTVQLSRVEPSLVVHNFHSEAFNVYPYS